VIQELKGEKIDIVPWSDNHMIFVRSALAPAEISSIRVDERNRTMEIMVEDNQLSLAIGKKGQNVRLAAEITGWRLDIISKSKLHKKTEEAVFNLQHIEGVNDTLAQSIYQTGFLNVRHVAEADIAALQNIPGFESEEGALKLKEKASEVVEKAGDLLAGGRPADDDAKGSFTATPGLKDAKALADERLKAMFKAEAANEPAKAETAAEAVSETSGEAAEPEGETADAAESDAAKKSDEDKGE
jgi:transcription termination/antitermination protein NusA